ncbi:Kidins220 [Symbiodinium natans]|uniref:Kidins220 protein n=1 Tax=Symbiodinium natans TaxID=878477 RepID=A0A812NJH7_9DINO|nr:Kidins220 [Symbiodinium natans]
MLLYSMMPPMPMYAWVNTWGMKGKGKVKGKLLKVDDSLKVWLGNVPESIRWKELREHIDQHVKSKWVETFHGKGKGTAAIVFASADEASRAIHLLNRSTIRGHSLVADRWVPRAKDLIHEHVLYNLHKNADVSQKVQQVTQGVYLLGHEAHAKNRDDGSLSIWQKGEHRLEALPRTWEAWAAAVAVVADKVVVLRWLSELARGIQLARRQSHAEASDPQRLCDARHRHAVAMLQ